MPAGWTIPEDVPPAMRTPNLCAEAVRECGRTLKFVPDALKTRRCAGRQSAIWERSGTYRQV
jgi:hypothetical protein